DHNETLLPRLDTTVTPLPLKDHTDTPLPHEDHNETLLPHSNTTDNRVYEEVMELNQQPDADAAVTTIDSSFSLQEQPPESLYYTSISFTNNSLH
ncbi:hypothetical protein JZ751_024214, partial [Albula glossodonta]